MLVMDETHRITWSELFYHKAIRNELDPSPPILPSETIEDLTLYAFVIPSQTSSLSDKE